MSTQYQKLETGNSRSFGTVWQLAADEAGDPVTNCQYTDKSVEVEGVFGGASVVIEGSNRGVTWHTLTDFQGNDLVISSEKIKGIAEATKLIRARVEGGGGTTALTITFLVKE